MAAASTVLGTALGPEQRALVLRKFCHRFTGDHKPGWAFHPRPDGSEYQPHFASDAEWLANTHFYVRKDGKLDQRYSCCVSNPTWPRGRMG